MTYSHRYWDTQDPLRLPPSLVVRLPLTLIGIEAGLHCESTNCVNYQACKQAQCEEGNKKKKEERKTSARVSQNVRCSFILTRLV